MRIVFVCIGNVCRSPSAEIVLKDMLHGVGQEDVEVWSAGVQVKHGEPVDPVSLEVLTANGYDGASAGSQPFAWGWADTADLILPMDSFTRSILRIRITDKSLHKKIRSFADFCPGVTNPDIFNPWGHERVIYESVFQTIEQGCAGIMEGIQYGRLG
ncbi:arsenate reductase/protein-tyrosine-phosphatase family protein [Arthrobacter antibioticus]|uniref:arsenate reductase/protein-tyrosine-phosphatase family protein n=1 Tax=Arthrobacter sp. H35-MC1 TaxID=3046203 RepID=UPI0024BA1BF4|nr:hypothetical protein [Arthrobacter sp. H35-MC1]MDJ0317860.1 hypothetical protein [Arthrobacter sp. H35-MC1]